MIQIEINFLEIDYETNSLFFKRNHAGKSRRTL